MQIVKVPFTAVEDKDVTVTDSDISAYMAENKGRFTTEEETRTMDFVSFAVTPSVEDSNKLRARLYDLKAQFSAKTGKEDSTFAAINGGGYSDQYSNKEGIRFRKSYCLWNGQKFQNLISEVYPSGYITKLINNQISQGENIADYNYGFACPPDWTPV